MGTHELLLMSLYLDSRRPIDGARRKPVLVRYIHVVKNMVLSWYEPWMMVSDQNSFQFGAVRRYMTV